MPDFVLSEIIESAKDKRYVILEAVYVGTLESLVNEFLINYPHFIPVGGVTLTRSQSGYCQIMFNPATPKR